MERHLEQHQLRSMTLAVAKAIAIIAMVVGHADAPGPVTGFIYTWHMPLFFIAAGFFFSDRAIDDPWGFVSRRFSKLYIPMVKWSVMFLLLHNVWFHLGVLNEQYGNWSGGVTHPYTWNDAAYRLAAIFTSMSGYDEFMAGAFWFFRGLLVASILFMVVYRLLRLNTRLAMEWCVLLICVACVALVALRLHFHVKLSYYPNGGWREMWGVFFFGVGVLARRFEAQIPTRWYAIVVGLAVMLVAGHNNLRGMNNGAMWNDLWSLPLTGTVGFLTVYALSRHIALGLLGAKTGALLTYIGNNTMPVYVFHIISYKLVSLVKIWWYDLDPGQIGCHMVIHYNNTDPFWVLYAIVGVSVPLLVDRGVKILRTRGLPQIAYLRRNI